MKKILSLCALLVILFVSQSRAVEFMMPLVDEGDTIVFLRVEDGVRIDSATWTGAAARSGLDTTVTLTAGVVNKFFARVVFLGDLTRSGSYTEIIDSRALAEVVNIDAWNPITDDDSLIVDQSTLEDLALTSRAAIGDTNQFGKTDVVSSGAITTSGGAVSTVTTVTNLTTNNDKTDYTLSATGIESILNDDLADNLTQGTVGAVLNAMGGTQGTPSGTPTAPVFDSDISEVTDDHFNGGLLMFLTGANAYQYRPITDYTGLNKTFTVNPPFLVAPSLTDIFVVLGGRGGVEPTILANNTLDITAAGEAGIDWSNVGAPTSTVGLTNTTVGIVTNVGTVTGNVDGSVGSVTGAVGSVTAQVSADVTAISGDGPAADSLELALDGTAITIREYLRFIGEYEGAACDTTFQKLWPLAGASPKDSVQIFCNDIDDATPTLVRTVIFFKTSNVVDSVVSYRR